MINDSIRNSDSVFINFCSSLSGSSIDLFTQAENNYYSGNEGQAQSLASAVTPTNDVEMNYQQYYQLYNAYINSNFTNADSSDLFELATKCPGLDGSCVYQARALYCNIYRVVNTFIDNCPEDEQGERKAILENLTNATSWNIDVFPNPASNKITIINDRDTEQLIITIKDVNDRLLTAKNLTTENFMATLDLNLINGIYLLTIKNSHAETIIKKLVITN